MVPEVGDGEWAKWEGEVRRYQLPVIREIHPRDLMCSMVTPGHNPVLCIWKLLRE